MEEQFIGDLTDENEPVSLEYSEEKAANTTAAADRTDGVYRSYTNIVENGDFSNGISGWSAVSGTLSVNSGHAVLTGDGTNQTVSILRSVSMEGVRNKVLVVGATFTAVSVNAYSFDIVLFGYGGNGYSINTLKTGGISNGRSYTIYSARIENNLSSITQAAVRYSTVANASGAIVNIDNVILIEGENSDVGLSTFSLAEKYGLPLQPEPGEEPEEDDSVSYVDVIKNGVAGDGITDDSSALQAIFTSGAASGGDIYFAPKTYLISSDVRIISYKKSLRLIGYGAAFKGAGKIIIDSSKRVEMTGFNLKEIILCIRGVWWSSFKNMDVGQLVVGDRAGSLFNDNYWNDFYKVGMGQLLLDSNRGHFNANSFYSCYFRSDPNQGFVTQYDYNIKIKASNAMLQNNNLYGCDLSYAGISPLYIDSGNTRKDTCITFDRCYFDTSNADINQNAVIVLKDCLTAAGYLTHATTEVASKTEASEIDSFRFSGWQPTSAYNLFKDGTFMTGVAGGRIVKDPSTILAYSKTGGVIHGYVDINQPRSLLSIVYFIANATVEGYYTNLLYLKNNEAGNKTLRIAMGNNYFNVTINNTKWTRVSLCGKSAEPAGNDIEILIYAPDNTPYNIRVGCVGIMLGRQSQLLPIPDYKAYIDSKSDS